MNSIFNFKLNKTSSEEIVLGEDQQNALEKLNDWLIKPIETKDDCFFTLTGAAGTGKTTLLKAFYDNLPHFYQSRTCVSAPTHKAKKVVQSKTGCPNSETVQGLLGLKPDVNLNDFDPANPVFNPIGLKKINEYKLLKIDESSMINRKLSIYLMEEAWKSKSKILFIGDVLQLPPIEDVDDKIEKFSKNENNLSITLTEPKNRYELTKVIRQSNTSPLLPLLDLMREDILNNTNNSIKYLFDNKEIFNEKGEGFKVMSPEDFTHELCECFRSEEYTNDKNFVRYLSYKNKSILQVNKGIRKKAFELNKLLGNGELLLGYNTITDSDKNAIIVNSDDYIVVETTEKVDAFGIKVIVTHLKAIDYSFETTVNILCPEPNNVELFKMELINFLNEALLKKGRAWIKYYNFKNSYCLIEPVFNGNKSLAKKDIDYGYGITVHKSQGSTYNTVFVNARDILSNSNEIERKKLLYVAISRASHRAYINL